MIKMYYHYEMRLFQALLIIFGASDICAQADLHQIEDLKETLLEELSSINFDERLSAISFGLLDEDWIRLRELENRIPEASVLKDKVLLVFRILIAALYQAHGTTFGRPIEQDGNFFSAEERNEFGYEEENSSNELELGESKNNDVVAYDSYSNTWTTNSISFDKHFEDLNLLNSTTSKYYPVTFDIPPTTSKQVKYNNNIYLSYNMNQTTMPVNYVVTNSNEEIDPSTLDSTTSLTNKINESITDRTLEHIVPQILDATTEESSVSIKNEQSKNENKTNMDHTTNFSHTIRDYIEGKLNYITSEGSSLQKKHNKSSSEYFSNEEETTSTTYYTKLLSPVSITETLNDDEIYTDILPFNKKDISITTVTLIDLTASSESPELIKLVQKNEGIYNPNHERTLSFNDHIDSLNVFASTTETWEHNHIIEDLDGSDSVINEVVLQKYQTYDEQKEGTDSDLPKENVEAVIETIYQLTDSPSVPPHQSDWQSRESDTFDYYEKYNYNNTLSTMNPIDISIGLKGTLLEKEISVNDNDGNYTKNIIPENYLHTVSTENENLQNSTNHGHNTNNEHIPESGSGTTIAQIDDLQINNNSDNNYFSQTKNNGASPIKQTILESSDQTKSAETGNWESGYVFTATNNNGPLPTKDNIPESSEHVLSDENENFQSISVERSTASSKNNNGSQPTKDNISESSEHVLSAENDNLQSISVERITVGSINNNGPHPTKDNIPQSSDHVLSAENDNFQSSSVERSILSSINNDGPHSPEDTLIESSEHILSAENDSSPNSSKEKGLFRPMNDENATFVVSTIPKSLEDTSSYENRAVLSIHLKTQTSSSTNKNIETPSVNYSHESPNHVSSSSIGDNTVFSLTNSDETGIVSQLLPESSESIVSLEDLNFQGNVKGNDISRSRNNDVFRQTVKVTDESSEHTISGNFQSSNARNYFLSSENDDGVQPTGKVTHDNSEHMTSTENENLSTSNVERIINIQPSNIGTTSPSTKHIPESSELVSSAENVNMPIVSKGMGELSKEDRPNWTPYSSLNRILNNNISSTDSSENIDSDEHELNQGTTSNQPQQVDGSNTVTEQTKESYRTFHVLFSKPPNSPPPTQLPNELNIYPAYTYPYRPSNFISRPRCRNGNDCVQVQHIEYRSNENLYSTRLSTHLNSRYR